MNLKRSCLILSLLSLTSCTVKIPDIEICADLSTLGATCVTSISGKQRDIEKEQWDKDRYGQLCMTSESYGEIKKAILKLCKNSNICVEEAKKQIDSVDANVSRLKHPKSAN